MLEQTCDQHRALWHALGCQLAVMAVGGHWAHRVSQDLSARPQHTCGVSSVGAMSAVTLHSCSAWRRHRQWMPGGNSPFPWSSEETG